MYELTCYKEKVPCLSPRLDFGRCGNTSLFRSIDSVAWKGL